MLHQFGVDHVFYQHRLNALLLHLFDQASHACGAGAVVGVDALWGIKLDVIALAQVGKLMVRGERFALVYGYGIELLLRPSMQLVQLALVLGESGLVIRFAYRVGSD